MVLASKLKTGKYGPGIRYEGVTGQDGPGIRYEGVTAQDGRGIANEKDAVQCYSEDWVTAQVVAGLKEKVATAQFGRGAKDMFDRESAKLLEFEQGGVSESVARHSESLDLWDLKQNSEQNLEQNLERSKTKVFAQG